MEKRFKHAIIDLDIPIFKASAIGQQTWYHLYNEDGELLESFKKAKEVKSYIEDAREFMGQDVEGWYRESTVEVYDFEECTKALDGMIEHFIEKSGAEKGMFSIGGSGDTFRDELAKIKKYKGNREGMEKPVHHKQLKEYAIKKYNPKIVTGIESDDQISIWLYKDYLKGAKTKDKSKCQCVMIDLEKDCRTTPGFHYDPYKDEEPVWISTKDANKWVFTMALGGDSADCYSGVRGYGYKKAEKVLEDCNTVEEMWHRSVELFKEVYGEGVVVNKAWNGDDVEMTAEDMFIENFRLALMLRQGDPEKDWLKFKRC